MFYKLYTRMYGGASCNIQGWHEHTQNEAKFVNLFDMMLSNFFGRVIMLRATQHMGNNMAQVSQKIWNINIVGTIQVNRTGDPMAAYLKGNPMKKRTYKYKMCDR